jgi:hypothetical protein
MLWISGAAVSERGDMRGGWHAHRKLRVGRCVSCRHVTVARRRQSVAAGAGPTSSARVYSEIASRYIRCARKSFPRALHASARASSSAAASCAGAAAALEPLAFPPIFCLNFSTALLYRSVYSAEPSSSGPFGPWQTMPSLLGALLRRARKQPTAFSGALQLSTLRNVEHAPWGRLRERGAQRWRHA